MQPLIKIIALFFAVTHLWVSGSLLLHRHDPCEETDAHTCEHKGKSAAHDDCAICYYIYLPNSISPGFAFQWDYILPYFYLNYSISIDPIIVKLTLLANANKGPPTLILG